MSTVPESQLVATSVEEHGAERVAEDEGELLRAPEPGDPAGALLGGRDVRGEAAHAQVPHRAAAQHVVDVGQPQRLQRQLRKPDL